MSEQEILQKLLNANPSPARARDLVKWADSIRQRIVLGDMMIGILDFELLEQIPIAYRAAAESGDEQAWITLANWQANPQVGEPNLDEAERSLREAINRKVADAPLEMVKLRWFYKREFATEREKKEAYQIASEQVARDGKNSEAVYFLALLKTHGFGVDASPEEGFSLQQQAADLGNADAMFEIYIHHATGLGVPVDESASLKACQQAAELGHSRAMYNMGAFNASGHGMPKNMPEACKWYGLAAEEGNPAAMVGLAVIYATGDGVKADRAYAEQLLEQADYLGLDVSRVREQLGL